MTDTYNCWEILNCGREEGGSNTVSLGVCPASTCRAAHGVHYGTNGGRACWALDGTLCDGKAPQTAESKMMECAKCAFYFAVHQEETDCLLSLNDIRSLVAAAQGAPPLRP